MLQSYLELVEVVPQGQPTQGDKWSREIKWEGHRKTREFELHALGSVRGLCAKLFCGRHFRRKPRQTLRKIPLQISGQ